MMKINIEKNIELMGQILENINGLKALKKGISKEALASKTVYQAADIIRQTQQTVEYKYETTPLRHLYYMTEMDSLFKLILECYGGVELANAIHAIEKVGDKVISHQYYIYSPEDHAIYQSDNQGAKNRFNKYLEEEREMLDGLIGRMIEDECDRLMSIVEKKEGVGYTIFNDDEIN